MLIILIAALLPGLYWEQGTQTAPQLKQAGIQSIYVPAGKTEGWNNQGVKAVPVDLTGQSIVKVPVPKVDYQTDVASATRVPWIDSNGWRFQRDGSHKYYYDVPAGSAVLAAAEAYAYGVDAIVHPDPKDLDAFGSMLTFLHRIDSPRMPEMANIGLIDDGSDVTAEVMNLLTRHNLLFRIVQSPDPKLDLNVRIGSKEFPADEAADPAMFAQLLRQKLTDAKRLLRLYGSDVVIGRLTGEGGNVRLHLLNYSHRKVVGLRVRVLGKYPDGTLSVFGMENEKLVDFGVRDQATEFTIPEMGTYAVVDLHQ